MILLLKLERLWIEESCRRKKLYYNIHNQLFRTNNESMSNQIRATAAPPHQPPNQAPVFYPVGSSGRAWHNSAGWDSLRPAIFQSVPLIRFNSLFFTFYIIYYVNEQSKVKPCLHPVFCSDNVLILHPYYSMLLLLLL